MGEQAICAIKSLSAWQLHIFTSMYKCRSKFLSLQVPAKVMQDPWNDKDLWTTVLSLWSCCSLQVSWVSTRSPVWSPAWLCGSVGSIHTYGCGERRCTPHLTGGKAVSKWDTQTHLRGSLWNVPTFSVCVMFAKGAVIALSLCVVSVNLVLISLYP